MRAKTKLFRFRFTEAGSSEIITKQYRIPAYVWRMHPDRLPEILRLYLHGYKGHAVSNLIEFTEITATEEPDDKS